MNKITVAELRRRGYKVRVTHFRRIFFYLSGEDCRLFRMDTVRDAMRQDWISAVGGETRVEILTPKGESFTGIAKCSNKDNYNKKYGVELALERALKSYIP